MKCKRNLIDSTCVNKLLYPGKVSSEHFECLIMLSRVRGEKIIVALEAFLVKGRKRKDIFENYNISPGYFSLKLNQVRACNRAIAEILPFYMR
ncbi:transcriptional regulator [Salmonella enterica]|nr:transcriptional regulator [Salmonella enterica]EAV4982816.1 transcriptional regulator [Salmonella enterica]ECC3213545.1 transcriptional regulator [Salmonella enterica subsp. diarizonae]EDQ3623303.1 transcriptional regulator [Salmonella enterica subsp. diarizonae]ELO2817129.1 transcriptional regulator [Salmonella enterica]